MDDFNVTFGMGPPLEPPADADIAVGSWACSCGVTKWENIRGPAGWTTLVRCLYCGESAELLPLTEVRQ